MLHLRQRLLLPMLRAASTHLSSSYTAAYLHLGRRLFLSTAVRSAATAIPFSVEDYLVATCGLTASQAVKSSAKLSRLKSASNPDAMLALLSGVGLSRADIAAVVATDPLLLCSRVNNIARRIASLRDRVGLSDPQIRSILLTGSVKGLRSGDIASRLEFWIPLFGSVEVLLKIMKANYVILTADIEKVIKPNIALLQECGLTVCDIARMPHTSRMLTTNPKRVETSVQRAGELGIPRSSGLFKYMLLRTWGISEDNVTARMKFLSTTLGCSMDKIRDIVCKCPTILGYSQENLRSKIEFLATTLGCSQEKICAAVCKMPNILGLSDENIRRKIKFMITEFGLEPEYIVERPWRLSYSLEKRIMPRHSVIKILREVGLIKEEDTTKLKQK
uniref:Uncharacterized protein n=1 Tax=Leersia perrieri TaxID=77586 RepID=A0A0D9XQ65_9ORYZ